MYDTAPPKNMVTFEFYTPNGGGSRRQRQNYKQDGRPKPHVCEVCDRAFDRPSALLQHNHTHTGERPHLCPVCKQKRFATTSNLYRHSRSCRGAKSDFISVSYGERVLGSPAPIKPHYLADSAPDLVPRGGSFMDPAMYSITPPPDDRMGYSPQLTTGDNLDMNAYPSYGGLHSAIIRPEGEDDDSREAEAAYPTSTRSSSANSPNRAPPGLRRTKPGIGGDDYDPAQTPPMLSTSPAPLPTPRSSFSSSREPTHTLAPFSPPMYPVKNAVSPVPREYSEPSFRSNSSQWLPSIASLNLPAPSWPPAGPAPLPPMNLNRGPTGRSISHDTYPRLPLQR